jgi:hypothetical protein
MSGGITLVRQNLHATCDSLEVLLSASPDVTEKGEMGDVTVTSIEAIGSVQVRRTELEGTGPDQERRTVLARGESAFYDVLADTLLLGGDPAPDAMEQVTTVADGRENVSRKYIHAKSISVSRSTGDVVAKGIYKMRFMPTAGPLTLPNRPLPPVADVPERGASATEGRARRETGIAPVAAGRAIRR